MDEHVYPVEAEAMQAIDDEVKPGKPYPEILVGIRAPPRSRASGTSSSPTASTAPA